MQTLLSPKLKLVSVTTAQASDRIRLIDTITLAFAHDPVVRWMYPRPQAFLDHFPEFVDGFGGAAFDHETAHVAGGGSGAALWLPPGVHPDDERLVALLEATVTPHRLPHVFEMLKQMGAYHPAEPHWHLALIGVAPLDQRRGIGSALLTHMTAQLDRDQQVAYLESCNPLNDELYQRFGFEPVGKIQVGDAPPLVPMVRRPR